MGCAADGFVSVVDMDDSTHGGVPCARVGGEDTYIVEDSPLGHLAACDAGLVREVVDKDILRLVNADGTLDASDERHTQEVEGGEVDQKLLGCKVHWANEKEAMIAG